MNFQSARIIETQARVFSLVARVEGMRAANQQREAVGSSMAYDETAFDRLADQMSQLADEIRVLAETAQ